MSREVLANEAGAAKRRVYFDCRDVLDGMTEELGEAGGQPQISTNGGAWTNVGIGPLTAIGNGRYYADLTLAAVGTAGEVIETRYKSAATAETPGDTIRVVAFNADDASALGLSRLDAAVSSRNAVTPPTVAELNARTLLAAEYGTAAAITALNDLDAAGIRAAVGLAAANLDTQLGTLSTHSAASVVALMNDLDAAGIRAAVGLAAADMDAQLAALPTAGEIKTSVEQAGSTLAQLLTLVTAIDALTKAAGNGDLAAVKTAVDLVNTATAGLSGDAMRGTDLAALATVCTEARLAELDAVNMPADIDTINAATAALPSAAAIAQAVEDQVVEAQGNYTIGQILSATLAVLAGVTTGSTFKTPDGVAARVVATLNASQERTAMAVTPSA